MKRSGHGGDIYTFSQKLGVAPEAVIDFSSNINCYMPAVRKDFERVDMRRYADPNYPELKHALACNFGVDTAQIALFNGISSAIAMLLESEAHVTLYAPAYSEYRRYAKRLHLINRFDELYALPPKGSLVVFVNPATPDGRYYTLERLFAIWRERECTVLVDESFLSFTELPSALSFLQSYSRLYLLKSLTKFYACAGVRVGAVISTPDNISKLHKRIPMWNLSTFDAAYIEAVLQDGAFVQEAKFRIREDKKMLYRMLTRSPLVEKVYPSDANFFLIKLKGLDAPALQRKCEVHNILIRNCANFDFLDASHVRLAVRPRTDLEILQKVFDG